MTTLESLSANRNPPNLKELQRLQQQTTQLQCMLIIHKTSLCVVVDANIVIVIELASLMLSFFVCDIWVSPYNRRQTCLVTKKSQVCNDMRVNK